MSKRPYHWIVDVVVVFMTFLFSLLVLDVSIVNRFIAQFYDFRDLREQATASLLEPDFEEVLPFRIAVSELDANALFFVALEKGFFEQVGLMPEVSYQSLGKFSLQELKEGNVDIATTASPPFISSVSSHPNLRMVATVHADRDNVALVVNDPSPRFGIQDLANKKVGTSLRTVGEYFLYSLLFDHSLSFDDIEVIDDKPIGLVERFLNGELAAVSLREPFISEIVFQSSGDAAIYDDSSLFIQTFNLVSTTEYIEANAEIFRRLFAALELSHQYLEEFPQDSYRLIADQIAVSPEYLNHSYKNAEFGPFFHQVHLLGFERVVRWYSLQNPEQFSGMNILDYMDPKLLDDFKSDSVSIIY